MSVTGVDPLLDMYHIVFLIKTLITVTHEKYSISNTPDPFLLTPDSNAGFSPNYRVARVYDQSYDLQHLEWF